MGFVILAASLKYLANVDAAKGWGLLTRERFLAAWVVLFAMAGLYLLGYLRLEGIKPDEPVGLGRLLVGMGLLIFAISIVPGMFGRPLGDLDAYVPAATGSEPGGGGSSPSSKLVWMTDQYRAALDRARREGKLLFVDFTGIACANCHWMRANMFTRPAVESALDGFVLVELYTDRGDAISDENQNLQLAKFKTIAQPFYAILDANENAVATFDHKTSDEQEFLSFLRHGRQPAATAPATSAGIDLPGVKTLDGAAFDTSSLAGKVVVVNFWATWCVPCIGEIPTFNEIHRDLGPKGVVVLGVLSLDDDGTPKVPDFRKKHPMDYTVLAGSDAAAQKYQLENLPVTVIFDGTGKQVQRFGESASRDALRAAVEKAL
jgi:thiol:disulfide interchange protein DsbD